MPDYNPFWEEEDYKDEPEWWHWYHLGYDDGYRSSSTSIKKDNLETERLRSQVEAMEALIAANFRVNPDLVLDDKKDKTPVEQS